MRKVSITFCLILFSISVLYSANVKKDLPMNKPQKMQSAKERDQRVPDKVTLYKTTAVAPAQGEKVGETAYNVQTNGMMRDRIIWNPDNGAIHVQWMYGDIAETTLNFTNRYMYYNYYTGSEWQFGLGQPIESGSKRFGYGSLEVGENFEAMSISHSNDGMSAYKDFQEGFGFFVESPIWTAASEPPVLDPTWGDIARDQNGNWHAVASVYNNDDTKDIVNDVKYNVLYWRSTDQGATWSDYYGLVTDPFQFPITPYDDTVPKELDIEKLIEASDTDPNTIAVLISNYGHDLIWYESNDAGATWQDPKQIIGNAPIVASDSITLPPQYDIVIQYDSLNTDVPIDTSLFPWEEDYNIDSRPLRHVDCMYINGEPHVVWAQTKTPGDVSYYPAGRGISYNAPQFRTLKGDTLHWEAGFRIKHWSPSTGLSMIEKVDDLQGVYAGGGYTILAAPQICTDASGDLYCIYARTSKTDTVLAEDEIDQQQDSWGPLSFCRLWGSKSTDGGNTWTKPVQLTDEEANYHRDLRYHAVSNHNPDDALHLLFQDSQIPASAVNDAHTQWADVDIIHWECPTSLFSDEYETFGPELEIFTNTKEGILDFGDIDVAGEQSMSFTVKNIGDEDLVVEPMFTGLAAITASPNEFTVPPGGEQEVAVTLKTKTFDGAVAKDSIYTYLAIPNNDESEKSCGLRLAAFAVPNLDPPNSVDSSTLR